MIAAFRVPYGDARFAATRPSGLLNPQRTKARGRLARGRIIYQRPTPHSTLLNLLQNPVPEIQLDGELFPGGVRTETSASSDGAVAAGLRNLLGSDSFPYYAQAPADHKHQVLIYLLKKRQDELLSEATAVVAKSTSAASMRKWKNMIPSDLRVTLNIDAAKDEDVGP